MRPSYGRARRAKTLFVLVLVSGLVLSAAPPPPPADPVMLSARHVAGPLEAAVSAVSSVPRLVSVGAASIARWFTSLGRGGPASAQEASPSPSPSPSEAPRLRPDDGPSTRQERADRRSESIKHFQEPDGTFTAEIYPAPVHFRVGSEWRDIEPQLVPSQRPGYAWRMKAGPVAVEFAGRARPKDTVLITNGVEIFTIGPIGGTEVAPVVEGTQITYPGVWPGVDLRYTLSFRGVKEDLILHAVPEADHFQFSTGGTVQVVKTRDGGLSFETLAGQSLYTAPSPVMVESDTPDRHEPARSESLAYAVSGTTGDQRIDLSFDLGWVGEPTRQWPIFIDPPIDINPSPDTFVHFTYPTTNWNTEDDLRVGLNDESGPARTLLKFSTTGLESGKNILSADLMLRNHYSSSCTPKKIDVKRVNESWTGSSVTWSNQPSTNSTVWASQTFSHGRVGCASPNSEWVTWDITGLYEGWTETDLWPNDGLKVVAADESSVLSWRRFRSMDYTNSDYHPVLKVSYNSIPTAPTGLSPGADVIQAALTPTLSGTYNDPDSSDGGRLNFKVENLSGSDVWNGQGTWNTNAGTTSTATVPDGLLVSGTRYRWCAQSDDDIDVFPAWDGTNCPAGSIRYFTPDLDGPTGTLTAPTHRSTVSGTITLTAAPTDGTNGSGVDKVDFYYNSLGRKLLIGTDSSSSGGWTKTLDTTTLPEGRVNLSAEYIDVLGNASCGAAGSGVAVGVDNAISAPEPWAASAGGEGMSVAGTDGQVVLGTGQLVLGVEDDAIPGRGFTALFDRVYNSASQARTILGPGWHSSVDDVLIPSWDGAVLSVDALGREERYEPVTSVGLDASFFNNTSHSGTPVLTRVDSTINFDWGSGSPGTGVNADNFSSRWTGLLDVPTTGTWTFYSEMNAGERVLVDGVWVTQEWVHGTTELSGALSLSAGLHEIVVEHYESTGVASAKLSWSGPAISKAVVPASRFKRVTGFTSPAGVYASLERLSDGSYSIEGKDGTQSLFTAAGLQSGLIDTNGNTLSIARDAQSRPQYEEGRVSRRLDSLDSDLIATFATVI